MTRHFDPNLLPFWDPKAEQMAAAIDRAEMRERETMLKELREYADLCDRSNGLAFVEAKRMGDPSRAQYIDPEPGLKAIRRKYPGVSDKGLPF